MSQGLDPKWRRVRFVDAANMSTGFGGTGSTKTHPNDIFDGYLGGDYDAWYTAPSLADKIQQIAATLHPYPWEPGTVMRYRDQDYFLLGAAIEGFLKSVRGPQADLGEMVQDEVLTPIGIHQAPAVRTREAGGRDGLGLVQCRLLSDARRSRQDRAALPIARRARRRADSQSRADRRI